MKDVIYLFWYKLVKKIFWICFINHISAIKFSFDMIFMQPFSFTDFLRSSFSSKNVLSKYIICDFFHTNLFVVTFYKRDVYGRGGLYRRSPILPGLLFWLVSFLSSPDRVLTPWGNCQLTLHLNIYHVMDYICSFCL